MKQDSFNRGGGRKPREGHFAQRDEHLEFRRDGRPGEPREFHRENRPGKPHGFRRDGRPGDPHEFHRDGHPGKPHEFHRDGRPGGFHDKGHSMKKTARDVALKAVQDVVRAGAYASQAFDRQVSGAVLSEEDRRLAASIFYFAVENRLRIEWTLGRLMETKAEPVVSDIMHIAAAQLLFMDRIPDHAAVDEAVKQVRAAGREGLASLVNAVLRNLIRARDAGELVLPNREVNFEEYLSVRYSLSPAVARRLTLAYGPEMAEKIAAYTPVERTMTVRPNAMRMDNTAFEAYLTAQGFHWWRGMVEGAYILSGAGDLSAHMGYRKGIFSIQGESSMLAAQAVKARPGMQILDACAAPGGKSCLIAERMGGAGRVFAWDVHEHRVELIRAAAQRLGLDNVRPAVHDARRVIDSMALAMDAVLVDAPCSGLGVISDKPDIKYRLTDADIDGLLPLQRDILESCARCVKVGGRLVYSTCTILPEENEAQVQAFLARHPEFELDTDVSWLPESLRNKMVDGRMQLISCRDGLEGFFIAQMRRRSV